MIPFRIALILSYFFKTETGEPFNNDLLVSKVRGYRVPVKLKNAEIEVKHKFFCEFSSSKVPLTKSKIVISKVEEKNYTVWSWQHELFLQEGMPSPPISCPSVNSVTPSTKTRWVWRHIIGTYIFTDVKRSAT